MSNSDLCELNIRIPLNTQANAETIYEVLKVDLDQHEKFVKQQLTVKDKSLCVNFTAPRAKDLRSASSAFFEAFLLCNGIVNEFSIPKEVANQNG